MKQGLFTNCYSTLHGLNFKQHIHTHTHTFWVLRLEESLSQHSFLSFNFYERKITSRDFAVFSTYRSIHQFSTNRDLFSTCFALSWADLSVSACFRGWLRESQQLILLLRDITGKTLLRCGGLPGFFVETWLLKVVTALTKF